MAKQNTKTTKSGSSQTFFWVATLSALGSVLTHSYLLNEHLGLKYGQATGQSLCNFSETFNCAAVAASKFSEFLSAPMALWGAGTNLVLLLLLAYLPFVEDEKKPATTKNTLIVASFIAVASIVMAFISSVVIARYCPFCIVAYVLSFIALGAIFLYAKNSGQNSQQNSALSLKSASSDFKPLLILMAVMTVGVFITNERLKMSFGGDTKELNLFVQSSVNEWASAPSVKIETVEPLAKGASPDQAKMTIVEFADYRCIHCKNAAPTLKAFVNAHSDVRLEFQAWPLDGECNTSVSRTNGISCQLARAVNCVGKTGGNAWSAHDFIFANQDKYTTSEAVKADLKALSSASGADLTGLETCLDSDEAKSLAQRQSAVGTGLNIQGTPTIYVNGKKLSGGQVLPVLTETYRRIQGN